MKCFGAKPLTRISRKRTYMRTTEPKVDLTDSKDNVIFGVRSVDAKGHRSLIVIPEPER